MKKIAVSLLLTALMVLSACAGSLSGTDLPKADAVIAGKIMSLYDGSCLLAGEGASDLYMVSTEIELYDEGNQPVDASALKPGQTVEIGFSGAVMESYPARPGGLVYLRITGQGDDLVGFYQAVLDDLWNTDKGLNSGIDTLAFDLSQVTNLTGAEKAALIYIVSGSYNLTGISGTFDELSDQGYIDKDTLSFKSGMLFKLEVTETEEGSFLFNASKWRSGTGAYFYQNCRAQKNNGSWEYKIGSEAIS